MNRLAKFITDETPAPSGMTRGDERGLALIMVGFAIFVFILDMAGVIA